MKPNINKYLFSFIVAGLIFLFFPTTTYAEGVRNINQLFVVAQQKTIINYEKSQPSSIDNPVVDPNFNVMRSNDTESSIIYIVIGLLIAATIIPLQHGGTSLNKREFMNANDTIESEDLSNIIFITGGTKSGKS